MKLSEKGKENLQSLGFAYDCDGAMALLDDYEFDADEFQDVVVLTVEEAQDIFAIIEDCVSLDVIRMYKDLICDFQKRIEQAERER